MFFENDLNFIISMQLISDVPDNQKSDFKHKRLILLMNLHIMTLNKVDCTS